MKFLLIRGNFPGKWNKKHDSSPFYDISAEFLDVASMEFCILKVLKWSFFKHRPAISHGMFNAEMWDKIHPSKQHKTLLSRNLGVEKIIVKVQ